MCTWHTEACPLLSSPYTYAIHTHIHNISSGSRGHAHSRLHMKGDGMTMPATEWGALYLCACKMPLLSHGGGRVSPRNISLWKDKIENALNACRAEQRFSSIHQLKNTAKHNSHSQIHMGTHQPTWDTWGYVYPLASISKKTQQNITNPHSTDRHLYSSVNLRHTKVYTIGSVATALAQTLFSNSRCYSRLTNTWDRQDMSTLLVVDRTYLS